MKRDDIRQFVHIGSLAFAFSLPFVTAPWAFFFAICAYVHNVFLLPKYAEHLFRDKETIKQGIALYPLMIALLIILFPNDLNLACAAWAILACGDGFSNLIGKRIPIARIPWNPQKSFGGMAAFTIFASLGAFALLAWCGPIPSIKHLILTAVCASFLTAVYETIPLPWDDNLVVTLIGAAFIKLFWSINICPDSTSISGAWWGLSLLMNAGAAGLAWLIGLVSSTGVVGGLIIGTVLLGMSGWSFYLLLWVFFLFASIATRYGYREKEKFGGAQDEEGRRGAKHAVANCLLALFAIIAMGATDGIDVLCALFFCAAFATALGDTLSSEIGQVIGKNPFMPTTFRRVPPGTVGAVSIEGALAGMIGIIIFAAICFALKAVPLDLVPAVIIGGWIGFYAESYIGAHWMDEGIEVNNEWMNLLNTFIGGSMAMVIAVITRTI